MTKSSKTSTKRPHSISDWGQGMTKQSFRDECNINKIMDKFQRTGLINHYAAHAPEYMDIDPLNYHQAMNIIADANTMFEELPASVRAKFKNSPEEFLEFTSNPENIEELRKMGLAKPQVPTPTPTPTPEAKASPKAPQEPIDA